MSRLLFAPLSIVVGLLGALVGSRVFHVVWGAIDEEEPPDPAHRVVSWPKLLFASAVQGAIFRMSRTLVDHSARRAFYGLTGSWPGAERPDPRS
ncbi:MAG: DUF4235 domain-containing protein [Thermoleophilaceae bacterium]